MNKDLLIKEEMELFRNEFLPAVHATDKANNSSTGSYVFIKMESFLESSLSKIYEEGRKNPISANDDCNHEEYLYGRCMACGVSIE